MRKNLLFVYKLPILISTVLSIVFIALKTARSPWDILFLVLASFLGIIVLDTEYIINSYLIEPETDMSKNIIGFIKHKDFLGTLSYIHYHKEEIKEKSLNSAIFQIILAPVIILITFSTSSIFVKALVLSIFANSLYRLAENYYEGRVDEWFWALKNKPSNPGIVLYSFGLLSILVFCIYFF